MFQFQTGSIKSINEIVKDAIENKFQFQTGSIKSIATITIIALLYKVSIPNWFD